MDGVGDAGKGLIFIEVSSLLVLNLVVEIEGREKGITRSLVLRLWK